MFNLSTCLQLHHKSRQIDAVGKFKYLSNLIDSSLSWRLCRSEFSFSEKNYFHSWEVLYSTKGNFSIEFRKIWKVRSKICTSFFPLILLEASVCMCTATGKYKRKVGINRILEVIWLWINVLYFKTREFCL